MVGKLDRMLPSPLLKASAAFHVAAAAALCITPDAWPLWLAGFVADHMILSTVGLVPRGTLLGPNLSRLPPASVARNEVAITIDDGPDPEVTPELLSILARQGASATFFCVGERVRAFPQLARQISRSGHAVENHTRCHPYAFSLYGPGRLQREVAGCQADIAAVVGTVPAFFRAPAGLRNPLLQPVLTGCDVRLVSWTRRGFDTVESNPSVVRRRLLRDLAAGDILLLHDGRAARSHDGRAVILNVLSEVLESIRGAGLKPVTLRQAFGLESDGGRDRG
ncbi:MAG TPA: polysaccharide deacetylase family protein [Steroidobacteraceae bacterium]